MQGIDKTPQDPNWPEQSPADSERAGDYNYGPYDPWVSSFALNLETTYPEGTAKPFDLKDAGRNTDTVRDPAHTYGTDIWSPRIT